MNGCRIPETKNKSPSFSVNLLSDVRSSNLLLFQLGHQTAISVATASDGINEHKDEKGMQRGGHKMVFVGCHENKDDH